MSVSPVTTHFVVTMSVPVAPDKMWAIMRDFSGRYFTDVGGVPADTVTFSEIKNEPGATRSTTMMGPTLTEKLIAIDADSMSFEYVFTEFAKFPATAFKNSTTLEADGDGCTRISMTVDATLTVEDRGDEMPADGEAPFATRAGFDAFVTDLYTKNIEKAAELASA